MERPAVDVEGARAAQLGEAGAIVGGQDDRVDALALAVDQLTASPSTRRTRSRVEVAGGKRCAVAAVVEHRGGAAAQPAPDRRRIEAAACQPPVQIATERPLAGDAQGERVTRLMRATSASSAAICPALLPPPTTIIASPVAGGVAVLSGVKDLAGEPVDFGQGWAVRGPEAAGRGDHEIVGQLDSVR